MEDYYALLGVNSTASTQAIKKSFRKKIKEQHPDLRRMAEGSERATALLIQAYKTLSDPALRSEYDRTHPFLRRSSFEFNYREFLKAQREDLDSQAKLIFYDLLNDRASESIELFEQLVHERNFILEQHLDREDYMDCAYLLSEVYEKEGQLERAAAFLRMIAVFEFEKPYFRHFFCEVTRRLQTIVCLKMDSSMPPERHLELIDQLCTLEFSARLVAQLLKKAAEIHFAAGNFQDSLYYLERGTTLDRKLKGATKLKQKLERVIIKESLGGVLTT